MLGRIQSGTSHDDIMGCLGAIAVSPVSRVTVTYSEIMHS